MKDVWEEIKAFLAGEWTTEEKVFVVVCGAVIGAIIGALLSPKKKVIHCSCDDGYSLYDEE